MRRSITWLAIALLCSGCAHTLGYAGKNPGAVECDGKATITIQGSGAIAVGYGGTELNAGSIVFDCQKGSIKQYNPEHPIAPPPPK